MEKNEFRKHLSAVEAQWQKDLSVTVGFAHSFPNTSLESLLPDNSILYDTLLSCVAHGVGCDVSLLEWWCWDNDFGHNGLKLRIDGVLIEISEDNLYECLIYCGDN